MLTRINKHRDEAGFTLIELLVVVIIIGVLAAIAIPVFLNQRESAQNASIQSDMRNAAIQVETYYTQEQSYPANAAALEGADNAKIVMSTNNQMDYELVGSGSGFKFTGCNTASGDVFEYDSTTGGLDTTPSETNCTGVSGEIKAAS